MNDFYDYEPHRRQPGGGGGRWMAFIAVALIFAVLGGLGVAALTNVSGRNGSPDGAPVQANLTAPTAAPTASPAPAVSATQTLPNLGGKAFILTGDNPVVDIAEKLTPSVVGINNYQMITYPSYYGFFGGGRQPQQQQPAQETLYSTGSGVIITQDGYIITNNHVVADAARLTVTLPGADDEIDAKLVGRDANTDLAVLKIDRSGLPAAPLGDSRQLRVGELAIAIGNPLGSELAGTVTVGVISALDRKIEHEGQTFTMIQTDAAISPGNSGGALINSRGEVIGINTMKSSGSGSDASVEGIGFAIPISDAMPIVEELIQHGKVSRPMLGITGQEVGTLSQTYNIPQGVIVTSVVQGGPADRAGLQQYDIITKIDDKDITTFTDLSSLVQSHKIGDTVTVNVFRDKNQPNMTMKVTLSEMTDQEAAAPDSSQAPQATPQPWPPAR